MKIKAEKNSIKVDLETYQVEINTSGVLYIHDKIHGHTVLGVYGLPKSRNGNVPRRELINLNFDDNRLYKIKEDKLVEVWSSALGSYTEPKTMLRKEIGPDCPITSVEINLYINQGLIPLIKYMMEDRNISLLAAKNLVDEARYGTRRN